MRQVGEWPELPDYAFVAGRVATEDDCLDGRAVFYVRGSQGRPVEIAVPQYALLSQEDGSCLRVVLVQAQADDAGGEVVGLRDSDGGEHVALLSEVELVGVRPT